MMVSTQEKFVGPNLDLIEAVTSTQSNIRSLTPLSFDFWILAALYFLPKGLNTNHCLDDSSAHMLKAEQASQSWLTEEIFPVSEGSAPGSVCSLFFYLSPCSTKGKAMSVPHLDWHDDTLRS